MRVASLGLVVVVLGLVAAGCGGSETSESERYAEDVCTSVDDWQGELRGIATALRDDLGEGDLSRESVQDAIDQAAEATEELVGDLETAGPPQTEAGSQAGAELRDLADRLERRVDRAETLASEPAPTLSELVQQLGLIAAEVEAGLTDVAATYERLRELDPAGELGDAFRETNECEELDEP